MRIRLLKFLIPSLAVHAVAVAAACSMLQSRIRLAEMPVVRGESCLIVRLAPVLGRDYANGRALRVGADPVGRFSGRKMDKLGSDGWREPCSIITAEGVMAGLAVTAANRLPLRLRAGNRKKPTPARSALNAPAALDDPCAAALLRMGVATPCRIHGQVKPAYPLISRRRGEEGTVLLRVEVRRDGSQGRICLLQSSGHQRLDQAAIKALRAARFLPATMNGGPVDSSLDVPIRFRLVDAL